MIRKYLNAMGNFDNEVSLKVTQFNYNEVS